MSLIYREGSKLLRQMVEGEPISLKAALYSKSSQPEATQQAIYALLTQTLKYFFIIQKLIQTTPLAKEIKKFDKWTVYLMVHDLLFGKGIQGGGSVKKLVTSYKIPLSAELARLKIKQKVKDNKDLLPPHLRDPISLPRYARVNTLKTTVSKVISHLQSQYQLFFQERDQNTHESEHSDSELEKKQIFIDPHLPQLLVLPCGFDLHLDSMYLNREIILQDKASCLPAFLLSPSLGSHVIDACSAPGNKTSQLSAIMENTGVLYAFEKDHKRFKTLQTLTKQAGCANIQHFNQDFTKINPRDQRFAQVEFLLVDPSCSGSGIVNRVDSFFFSDSETDIHIQEELDDKQRLKSLAAFQIQVLHHALQFPSARKIVYSTCSTHQEENEEVVQKVLEMNKSFKLQSILPEWKRRGLPLFEGAENCIRLDPKEDKTHGFFVAVFEKVSNDHLNFEDRARKKQKK